MKQQLLDILWHVIAPAFYLGIAIFLLYKIWKKGKLEEDEE